MNIEGFYGSRGEVLPLDYNKFSIRGIRLSFRQEAGRRKMEAGDELFAKALNLRETNRDSVIHWKHLPGEEVFILGGNSFENELQPTDADPRR
jgi:hypothetical protein